MKGSLAFCPKRFRSLTPVVTAILRLDCNIYIVYVIVCSQDRYIEYTAVAITMLSMLELQFCDKNYKMFAIVVSIATSIRKFLT